MKYKFIDLIHDVLKESNEPLTPDEIWNKGEQLGYSTRLASSGKTPVKSLAARLYVDIRDNENTLFSQTSVRPAKFYLKSREAELGNQEIQAENDEVNNRYKEKDLHKLLATFVLGDQHFKCKVKTIGHEKSRRTTKGKNEWLHPDIVGVYYPFADYSRESLELFSVLENNPYKLYSFEMKKSLNFSNLREYYFQAVSNSSWAHEGYLVTMDISKDDEFLEELSRLNNAFGIGIIKLNPENITQSEVMFQAHEKVNIDWSTVERLVKENKDFKSFVSDILLDTSNTTNRLMGRYDECFNDDDDAAEYARQKGII